jgi:hypothetical protein
VDLRTRWLLLAAAAIVLVVHSLAYNFVTDDAYISFVYSRNLAEHGELTFNLGDHVEGYTNFLWTAVLGVLMVPGIPPEWSSRVLSTACALATLLLVTRTVERATGRTSAATALPALLLACSSGFACWTSGGLETQLFTVLVAGALDGLVAGSLRRVAICCALAAMTRPEGPLIVAVLGAAWYLPRLLQRKPPGRDELVAAAWFLALWAPWFAWRWWYYGWPFPNTYYVKASGEWSNPSFPSEMHGHGVHYLWVWLWQTKLVLVSPLAALGLAAPLALTELRADTPRARLALACVGLIAFYVPYTISVGGDFMGLHRFIMPLFVIAAIAVALGVAWCSERFGADARVAAVVIASELVLLFAASQVALTERSLDPRNLEADDGVIDTPAFLIVYTDDRAAIGRAMEPCFHDDDFSVVGGAGAQPYYGRMRAIDVFGLVSDRVAHQSPRTRPRAGHTKFASDDIVLSYDPTFVFSCYSLDVTLPARRFNCSPQAWLSRGYEQVTMDVPDMQQSGHYYTFFAKKARHFECPGRVR